MSSSEPLPFYLVVDMSQPAGMPWKNDLIHRIVDGLRQVATPPAADARVVLVPFAERACALKPVRLRDLDRPPGWSLQVGQGRRYAPGSSQQLLKVMTSTGVADALGPGEPLIVFVTDGLDPTPWQWSFKELVRTVDPTVVPIVHNMLDPWPPGCLTHPQKGRSLATLPREIDVADVVVDEVLHLLGQDKSTGRHYSTGDRRPDDFTERPARAGAGRRPAPVASRDVMAAPEVTGTGQLTVRMSASSTRIGDVRTREAPETVHSIDDDAPPGSGHPTERLPVVAPELPSAGWTPDPESAEPLPEPGTGDGTETSHDAAEWEGSVTPFVVGEPGAAADVRALPDPDEWNRNDTVCDGVTILGRDEQPVVEVRAASTRGRSHRYYGTVRQDDYAYRRTDDRRFLICAVSDGVSSGKLSHRAAIFVTRQGCELIAQQLRDGVPKNLDWGAVVQELAGGVIDIGTRLLERSRPAGDAGKVTPDEVAKHMAATAVFAVVELERLEAGFPVQSARSATRRRGYCAAARPGIRRRT